MAPGGTFGRRLLLGAAAVAYLGVFVAFYLYESPILGIGAFFYVPICLAALVTDEFRGAAAGLLATGLYVLAVVVMPHMPAGKVMTELTFIRLVTFVGVGALVGGFARRNRELVTQLRELASKDFLTGIGNARVFDEQLARRCAAGKPFTLVLADIDNLKQLNDIHGHGAGNTAIRRVAEALLAAIDEDDELARVGGDEFALLTDHPHDQTKLLCARVARTLAQEELFVSFGATSFPVDGTAAVELFRKADDRLFAAKLVSRNRRTIVALSGRRS
ncbi:MAG TPA: GGDEF domain-containing protein [Gaiellaceae bacterium]|nr:GGDEF domain-containing protein [Gaiellaceae bacterium]